MQITWLPLGLSRLSLVELSRDESQSVLISWTAGCLHCVRWRIEVNRNFLRYFRRAVYLLSNYSKPISKLGMDQHWLLSVRPAFAASFLKRLLGIRRRIVETEHGRFFVDPASNFGNAIIAQPAYEPQMLTALTSILREGDVYLDVGGNEGYFSIIASRLVGGSGRVLCVEPQSRLQEIIYLNMDLNSAFNISVFQLAISDAVGTARICLLPDMNTGGSGLFAATKYKVPAQLVPQTTLSMFVQLLNVEKIRLMKLDIEGFEHEAIMGSRDLFATELIENIALELHPSILAKRGKAGEEIVAFLEDCGYEQDARYETLIMSKKSAHSQESAR